ncbi:hypothetical protein MBLNU459_g4218t1 [Dothideomycetes sp. NU459]
MDGGRAEQAELAHIKDAVKENKRRKRKTQLRIRSDAREDSQPLATSLFECEDDQTIEDGGGEVTVSQEDHLSDFASPAIDYPTQTLTSPGEPLACRSDVAPASNGPSYLRFAYHREAELLMHYLDYVFALQFRFHSPSVHTGGRGWLLWLLTETKPLYHAALSLGALHQHSLLDRNIRGQRYHDTLNELNEHHNRALQELQIFLQSNYDDSTTADLGRKRQLQILACGTQLISFELFRGGTNEWQVHLDALALIVSSMQEPRILQPDELNSGSCGRSSEQHTPMEYFDAGSHDIRNTAEEFLTGATVWFDIVSCASTGKAPRLAKLHEVFLNNGGLDMEDVAGCQSWAAMLIGKIATLHAWKKEASAAKNLSMWSLFERAAPIRQQLSDRTEQLIREIDDGFQSTGHDQVGLAVARAVRPNSALRRVALIRAVTLVFAHAAQVYLNTTISGAHSSLDEIRSSVQLTADALRELRLICDSQTLRSLLWPICIAGSMAEDASLQGFFRELIEDLGEEAHDFGNSQTVLRIMDECWMCRSAGTPSASDKGWDWFTAMKSSNQHVLLV